jgi:isoleucyl-tRNA synthetase
VHLSDFPSHDGKLIDKKLEERMKMAQKISSMVLSLRRKQDIRVRQPLNKILVPVLDKSFRDQLEAVKNLVLAEVNVKEMEYLTDTEGVLVKKIKPNFKTLGPKVGRHMKAIAAAVAQFSQQDIAKIEREGRYELDMDGEKIELTLTDVEIMSEDIPGWLVASQGPLTVALDVTITEELRQEGIARELVNRIQNMRKDREFEVTDRIAVRIQRNNIIDAAVNNNLNYICSETLASSLELVDEVKPEEGLLVEVDEEVKTFISIGKLN